MNYYMDVPCYPMIYLYQTLCHDYKNFHPANIYYSYPLYMDHRLYSSPIYPITEIEYDQRDYRTDCQDAARINATMDYVADNLQNQGYHGGTPNFHQRKREDGQLVYGTIIFKNTAVDFHHVSIPDFGNVDRTNVGEMMRAAANYASKKGYGGAGLPTFHKGPNDYGVILFKRGTAEVRDVLAKDLGNPGDTGSLFRAVANYASRTGYGGAGFPNFHQRRREDGELVYGVILIKPGNADVRDVVARDLNLPRYEQVFGCSTPPPDSGGGSSQSIPFTYTIWGPFYLKGRVYRDRIEVDGYASGIPLSHEVIRLDGGRVKTSSHDRTTGYTMAGEFWVTGKTLHMSFRAYIPKHCPLPHICRPEKELASARDVIVFSW